MSDVDFFHDRRGSRNKDAELLEGVLRGDPEAGRKALRSKEWRRQVKAMDEAANEIDEDEFRRNWT